MPGKVAVRGSWRFWKKVTFVDGDGCWLWSGATNGRYGMVRRGNGSKTNIRRISAHRFAYEDVMGPIPAGLVIMHSCDTSLCVRPSHLVAGTYSDNTRDAIAKGLMVLQGKKERCCRGHAFSPANTAKGKDGTQRCRECSNAARRKPHGRGAYRPYIEETQ